MGEPSFSCLFEASSNLSSVSSNPPTSTFSFCGRRSSVQSNNSLTLAEWAGEHSTWLIERVMVRKNAAGYQRATSLTSPSSATSKKTSQVSQDRPVTAVRRGVLSYLDRPGDAARTQKPLRFGPGNPSTCPKPLPNERRIRGITCCLFHVAVLSPLFLSFVA